MRVPILSACCAALSLAALPAAAHGWSAADGAAPRNCPVVRPSHPAGHVAHPGGYHHTLVSGGCPVAQAAPAHNQYQGVNTPDDLVASQPAPDAWRQSPAWADGGWSGRGGLGCHDANGPQAYRDGAAHVAAPDAGMRCHDGGMRRELAYAQSSGQFGYTREMDSGWSPPEQRPSWLRP